MYKVFQYSFYPVAIFGLLGILFTLVPRVPDVYLLWVPVVILAPAILMIAILERFVPYRKDWNESRNDFGTDLIRTLVLLPFANKLCEFLLPFALYVPLSWIAQKMPGGLIESHFNIYWSFLFTLLLCEFCFYWLHKITHEWPSLWRLHEIHHAAERVYWANSGRFHFFDAVLGSIAYLLPLIVLGTSVKLAMIILVFAGVTGFLEHVNINFKAGYLNYIFNSAELHRWHHSEKEKESNNNFGRVLIVWDIVFGTFFWPNEREVKIAGVEGTKDPKGFLTQFLFPFRKK